MHYQHENYFALTHEVRECIVEGTVHATYDRRLLNNPRIYKHNPGSAIALYYADSKVL